MNKELEEEIEYYFTRVLEYKNVVAKVDEYNFTISFEEHNVIIALPLPLKDFMELDKAGRMLFILSAFIISTK